MISKRESAFLVMIMALQNGQGIRTCNSLERQNRKISAELVSLEAIQMA